MSAPKQAASTPTRYGQRGVTSKYCPLWHEFRTDGDPSALILSSADAALFAAAPALVEALEELLSMHDCEGREPAEAAARARAALKLARGEV